MPPATEQPRHTARGIVVHDDQLLLMERWRPGKHYFSVPGGGIEPGETPEQTVAREILEETGVRVKVVRPLIEMHDGPVKHHFYLCQYVEGEPVLLANSPEALISSADNRFLPKWVPVSELASLPLIYWEPIRPVLLTGLQTGFKSAVEIVSAPKTR